MSGFELVAGVIGIFFAAGIAMGVLLVAALPLLRRRRYERHLEDGRWPEPPGPGDDDTKPPRWPGA